MTSPHEEPAFGLSTEFISTSKNDSAVVHAMNGLFVKALDEGWSDIHIESLEDGSMSVRVRIDGILVPERTFTRAESHILLNKVRSRCRLSQTDTRSPQDGRFLQYPPGASRRADVRVSILQTGHEGSSLVMRILDSANAGRTIESLHLPSALSPIFMRQIKRKEGLFLVTGPTGSGKTTTLYAALNHLNDPKHKLVTIEDPIEYQVKLVQQVAVGVGTGRTFASVLRSILRQDPDIILVGEIRDTETAETSSRAAMTGHIVLSTLHANSSVDTVIRLMDMGLPLHTLKTALNFIMAQRLIRLLCLECREERPITPEESQIFLDYDLQPPDVLNHAQGCDRCRHTGYSGRRPIFEALEVSPDFWRRSMVRSSDGQVYPDQDMMLKAALLQPQYVPLAKSALLMAASGLTSVHDALEIAFQV